jgi:hypothetical protein
MIVMGASVDAGLSGLDAAAQSLSSAGWVVDAPKPGSIEAAMLKGWPIDEDGVRLTAQPGLGSIGAQLRAR